VEVMVKEEEEEVMVTEVEVMVKEVEEEEEVAEPEGSR
jgi:hypothetical protein